MTGPVSVVIPVFNGGPFVSAAVRSALTQSVPPKEVIVVDDGSTDGSADLLMDEFGAAIEIVRQRNAGVSEARNEGIARATGEYVAFLDADDAWLPAKLERQVARLAVEKEAGWVHCGVEDIDEVGTPLGQHLDGLSGWVADDLVRFTRPVILGGGSGLLVRRSVLHDVGGFDPALSTSADWDLFFRIAARHRVAFVAEVLLRYRLHGANMSTNVELMRRDMTTAFAKAFASGAVASRLRRPAYARLHLVLAASHLSQGRRRAAVRHAASAAVLDPLQAVSTVTTASPRLLRRQRRKEPAGSD